MVEMSKQDMESMQEKIKNMSPEELKQFQKQQCIFCHIISGKVASKKVYDDKHCIAVLDINPANPGHVLVIPKEHYPIMPLIPDDIIQHLGIVSKAISHVLLKTLKAEGTTIFVANGVAAGQRAQHFMIHVIPRKEGDKIGLEIPETKIAKNILDELQARIRKKANELFGIKEEEIKKEEKKKEKEKEEKIEREEKKEEKPEKPAKKKAKKKKKSKKEKKQEEEPVKEEVSLDAIAELLK